MVNTTGNKINSLQESVRVVETRILGSVKTGNKGRTMFTTRQESRAEMEEMIDLLTRGKMEAIDLCERYRKQIQELMRQNRILEEKLLNRMEQQN